MIIVYPVVYGQLAVGKKETKKMRILEGMKVSVDRKALLTKLHNNLEQHKIIVAEAEEGYLKKATMMLEERLGKLREGKKVPLSFYGIDEPRDYSKVYETAIHMLEAHNGDTVELTAEQFRMLSMDEWDWRRDFIGVNAMYSMTAARMSDD